MRFWLKLFSFEGRISALHYHLQLMAAVALLPLMMLAASHLHRGLGVDLGWTVATAFLVGPSLLAVLSGLVRRYHDLGLSGWWAAVSAVVWPLPWYWLSVPYEQFMSSAGFTIGFLLCILIGGGAVILPQLMPGQRGPNRYGRPTRCREAQ